MLAIFSALLSAVLVVLLRPLLVRYALARPNARSSHTVPTPQGAGIAVVAATLTCLVAWWAVHSIATGHAQANVVVFALATTGLAAIGFIDDVAPLSARVRLIVQTGACLGLLQALPDGVRALPFLPYPIEVVVSLIGLVWFVNLTNFMDGIDGMTVAGIVPMLAGVGLLALNANVGATTDAVIALTLAGALIGFAPYNHPIAKVFLGDVGSLAIGGMTGWLLLSLSCRGGLIAAVILALYYLADTTLTLFQRWWRGAQVGQAHREHFYQQATKRGLGVVQVISRVWLLNGALLVLALVAGTTQYIGLQLFCLGLASILTIALLRHFRG